MLYFCASSLRVCLQIAVGICIVSPDTTDSSDAHAVVGLHGVVDAFGDGKRTKEA